MDKLLPKPKDWNLVMMKMAFTISEMSKDPSTKVGAVVVSPNRELVSFGYNGFPKQIPDKEIWWENRGEDRYEFTKYELVIHAEQNAMSQPKCSLVDWSIYITHFPCLECAKRIVREGISSVYYSFSPEQLQLNVNANKVIELFKLAGIKLNHIHRIDIEYS